MGYMASFTIPKHKHDSQRTISLYKQCYVWLSYSELHGNRNEKKSRKQVGQLSWWGSSLILHIILRSFVEPTLSAGLFAPLSFDAGEWAVLARLRSSILFERPIYGYLNAVQRDGVSIYAPFYAATSFAAARSARATTSTTVSVERNEVKLCLTVCQWYNRRRYGLPESDKFESQRLIRRPSRGTGTSIIQRSIKDI